MVLDICCGTLVLDSPTSRSSGLVGRSLESQSSRRCTTSSSSRCICAIGGAQDCGRRKKTERAVWFGAQQYVGRESVRRREEEAQRGSCFGSTTCIFYVFPNTNCSFQCVSTGATCAATILMAARCDVLYCLF